MLTVKLSIDDGQGKKADLEITAADSVQKVMVIQNVFNLFGIDTDVVEMARVYNQIGQAYKKFFDQVKPTEPIQVETIDVTPVNEIREQLISGYKENTDELTTTYQTTDDLTKLTYEGPYTGTKSGPGGMTKYKLRYQCPICKNKGSHYVYNTSKTVRCQIDTCQHVMDVFPAHPEGFPIRDTAGNFFRAGEYRDFKLFPSA